MSTTRLPTEVSPNAFLAAVIVTLVATSIFVAIRVIANYSYGKRLLTDDCGFSSLNRSRYLTSFFANV